MLDKLFFVILVAIFTYKLSSGQLRITNGTEQTSPKNYMVYFVRADKKSNVQYDEWICGGAIVSPSFIVTAAACVRDVDYMYAIAGYKTYKNHVNIHTDPCANAVKKKVIWSCVPQVYNFAYDKLDVWSNLDIAVAKVESPYAFGTTVQGCSYPINKIEVNYNPKFTRSDVDAFVLGWGHASQWRQPSNTKDLNMETLQYAATKILSKEVCKEAYKSVSAEYLSIIDKYMICADGPGLIDSEGLVKDVNISLDKCTPNVRSEQCIEMMRNKVKLDSSIDKTRKNGICQNDHGGPLVTWIGSREFLIGVASVFRIDDSSNCIGPYLYTSTACNSKFLDCVISTDKAAAAKNSSAKFLKYKLRPSNPLYYPRRFEQNTSQPEPNTDKPESNTNKPEPDTDKPNTNTDKPESNTDEHKTNTDKPESNTNKPEPDTDKPNTNTDKPESNTDEHKTNTDKPEPNTNKPEPDTDKPNTNTDKPRSDTNKPTHSDTSSPFKREEDVDFSKIGRSGPSEQPSYCSESATLRGFEMIERKISWLNHPDGPADNERKENKEPIYLLKLIEPPKPTTPAPYTVRQLRWKNDKLNPSSVFASLHYRPQRPIRSK